MPNWNAEELTRVESLSELKPGMIIVIKTVACSSHKQHRMMLIKPSPPDGWTLDGYGNWVSSYCGWTVEPPPSCFTESRDCAMDIPFKEGRLFKVEDGLEADEKTKESKPVKKPAKKRVRVNSAKRL